VLGQALPIRRATQVSVLLILVCLAVASGCAPGRVVRDYGYGPGPQPVRGSTDTVSAFGLVPLVSAPNCLAVAFVDRLGRPLTVLPEWVLPVARSTVLTVTSDTVEPADESGDSDLAGDEGALPLDGSGRELWSEDSLEYRGLDTVALWESLAVAPVGEEFVGSPLGRGEPEGSEPTGSLPAFRLLAAGRFVPADRRQIISSGKADASVSGFDSLYASMHYATKIVRVYSLSALRDTLSRAPKPEHEVQTVGLPLHVTAADRQQISLIEQDARAIVLRRYLVADGQPEGGSEAWSLSDEVQLVALQADGLEVSAVESHGGEFVLRVRGADSDSGTVYWGSLAGNETRVVYEGSILAWAAQPSPTGISALFLSLPMSAAQSFHPVFGKMAVGGLWQLEGEKGDDMAWERLSRVPFSWLNSTPEGVLATVDQGSIPLDVVQDAMRTFFFASGANDTGREVSGACDAASPFDVVYLEGLGLLTIGAFGQVALLADDTD
jgi:hypothetical protein